MKDQNIFSLFGRAFGVLLLITASVFISVSAFAAADSFEPDNTLQNAKAILIHDPRPEFAELGCDWVQSHNFYDVGDEDWVKFYGVKDEIYTVKVKEPGSKCNAVIGIYDKFGDLVIPEEVNDELVGKEEYAEFICKADGIYYARIRQSSSAEYGENTDYKLALYIPIQSEKEILYGDISPRVRNITITTTGKTGTLAEGCISSYSSIHSVGSFILTATAMGYEIYTKQIYVKEFGATKFDIRLTPISKFHSADYNQDYSINLSEMLKISQLYANGFYHCDPTCNEDGYAPGPGDQSCDPHNSDYAPTDWQINYTEFSRILQFWNMGGYHSDPGGEDGFAPGRQ
ncbi:MAG: hypothetical protein BWK80_16860 [Desulfobacteraceae bacterium IS3]|nr:MAG: hypothetical protein BWK80_16860 [Desulfobacteraceae bacterium IS3]